MATQTGSIDMAAMAEAAKTANNYVTDLGDSGIRVHPADDADNYAAIDASGMSVVRDSESVAHFGEETRIGKSGESHMELDYHSMRMVDREGTEFFEIEDMRGSEGYVVINDRFVGTSERRGFTLTLPSDDTDYTVTVDGVVATPTLKMVDYFIINPAPAIGAEVIATYKTSSSKAKSFTIGTRDEGAVGACSIAEGYEVVASGFTSHAEGVKTVSSGGYSHAEGSYTAATGDFSHAEGASAVADGVCSHAQNNNTKAEHDNQTAIGMFNANDIANAFEIGNGTADDARSNAFTVAWDGTVTAAGEVTGATAEAALTLASGVTATTHTVKRSGKVVTVYVSELRLASELSNHATATVATVPDGYRPAYAAYAHLAGWNDGGSYVTVGTNGSVTLSNQSGASIPTTRALGFTLTYVM